LVDSQIREVVQLSVFLKPLPLPSLRLLLEQNSKILIFQSSLELILLANRHFCNNLAVIQTAELKQFYLIFFE